MPADICPNIVYILEQVLPEPHPTGPELLALPDEMRRPLTCRLQGYDKFREVHALHAGRWFFFSVTHSRKVRSFSGSYCMLAGTRSVGCSYVN